MKKQLFGGYSVRETEVMLGVLKDENKVLQQQIAEIKRMLKQNNVSLDRKRPRVRRADDEPAVLAPVAEAAAAVQEVEVEKAAKVEPVAEVAKVEPVAEVAEVEPVAEVAKAEPVAEVAEVESVAEVAEVEPVAEVAEVEPVAEVAEVESVAEVAEVEPVAEAVEVEPVAEVAEAEPVAEVAEVEPVAEAPAPKSKKVVRLKKVRAVKAAEIQPAETSAEEAPAEIPVAAEEVAEVAAAPEVVAETVPEQIAEVVAEIPAESEIAAEPIVQEAAAEAVVEALEPVAEVVSEPVAESPAEEPEPVVARKEVSEPVQASQNVVMTAAPEIHSNLFDISMRKHDAMMDRVKSAPIEAVLPEDIDGVVCIEKSVINDIGSIKDEMAELRNRLVRMQEYLDAVQKHKAQVNNKRILAAFQQSGMSVEDVLEYLNHKNRFDVSGR